MCVYVCVCVLCVCVCVCVYRAYISGYLQVAHEQAIAFLARFAHRGCCYGIYSLTKVTYGGTAANLRSLFRGRKFLKLLKRLTVSHAVPEIPLSVGSKPELLRAFVFAKFPYISPYTHAFVCVCIILPCIYMIVYACILQYT